MVGVDTLLDVRDGRYVPAQHNHRLRRNAAHLIEEIPTTS